MTWIASEDELIMGVDWGTPVHANYELDNIHYHHCPECYLKFECKLNCTIEPDLEEDGKRFGSHCECVSCEKKLKEEDKYKTKEFWDRYNGFIK